MLLLMIQPSCRGAGKTQPEHASLPPDRFNDFSQALLDQTAFAAEFQRLQQLFTEAPGFTGISQGTSDSRIALGSCQEGASVAITLTERDTGERWTLWAWDGLEGASGLDAAAIKERSAIAVLRDEVTSGGYKFEFSTWQEALTVSINARWVAGRYLQLSREFLLGGVDHTARLTARQYAWRLEGPAMPYRMLPAAAGPYAQVAESVDPDWETVNYPEQALLPVLATYSSSRGMLLGVTDDHPRKLDRVYDLGWNAVADKGNADQLLLCYRAYDGTTDSYAPLQLASGLTVRDGVALEPLNLGEASAAAEPQVPPVTQVIGHMADLAHAFHFVPAPPQQLPAGNYLDLDGWLADLDISTRPPSAQQLALPAQVNLWNISFSMMTPHSLVDAADGGPGLGIAGLKKGTEQLDLLFASIAQLSFPLMAAGRWTSWAADSTAAKQHSDWLLANPAGVDGTDQGSIAGQAAWLALDLRRAEVAPELLQRQISDLQAFPALGGFISTAELQDRGQGQLQSRPAVVSQLAAECAYLLRSAEAISQYPALNGDNPRKPPMLVTSILPRLCLPVSTSACVFNCSDNASDSAGVEQRYCSLLLERVFGAKPFLKAGSMAGLVLHASPAINGCEINKNLAADPYAEPFLSQLELLTMGSGSLRILYPDLHNSPPGADLPASNTNSMVAVVPAEMASASAVWIAFSGVSGSVKLDPYNMLEVSWGSKTATAPDSGQVSGSWSGKLPPGFWTVIAKDAENVPAGSCVLVVPRAADPLRTGGAEQG